MKDEINIDCSMIKEIIQKLIHSDGMEVTDTYLIKQKIYYIDNVKLIELLEKQLFEHYYRQLMEEHGYVDISKLYKMYSPQYINSDRLYNELETKYNIRDNEDVAETTTEKNNCLDQYF